jgi:Zn-dependent protease
MELGNLVLQIVTVLGVILFSMTLHEVMHGIMAYWLGDDTAKLEGRLTLNPTKHIDPILTIALPLFLVITSFLTGGSTPIFGGAKPVPFNPARVKYDEWGAALVALAGPLTNFVIAFLFFGVYALAGSPDGVVGQILMTMIIVNLGFFVFNMIPIPPLDGSRVIYALAPDFVRRGMEAIEQFGLIFVFVIIMLASSFIGMFMGSAISAILVLFAQLFGIPA